MSITVHLYKNFPFTDNGHRFYTKSKSIRDKYYESFISKTLPSQKTPNMKEQYMIVNLNLTIVNNYNYLDFTHKGQKYFCFIKDVEWNSNDKVCKIYFSIDLFSTYIYEVGFRECMIERKIVTDDIRGKYTLDEGFTPPRYLAKSQWFFDTSDYCNTKYWCIKVSDTSEIYYKNSSGETGEIYNVCKPTENEYSSAILLCSSRTQVQKIIDWYTDKGKLDAIISIYFCNPTQANPQECWIKSTDNVKINFHNVITSDTHIEKISFNGANSFDDYNVKNKKCLCYPFNFAEINNCKGQSITLKYENFTDMTKVSLGLYSSFLEDVGSYCFPQNYENLGNNIKSAISGKGCIEVPWTADTYASYYATHKNSLENTQKYIQKDFNQSMGNTTYGMATNLIGNIQTKNVTGGISTVGGYIKDSINIQYQKDKSLDSFNASLKDMSIQPDILKGGYTANLLYVMKGKEYNLIRWQAPLEYIKSIDQYFSKYGYKVNQIQKPKLHTHSRYNYIKTNDCVVYGNIPQIAKQFIENLFNDGVTLWHNTNVFDYSNNSVL